MSFAASQLLKNALSESARRWVTEQTAPPSCGAALPPTVNGARPRDEQACRAFMPLVCEQRWIRHEDTRSTSGAIVGVGNVVRGVELYNLAMHLRC